MEFAIDFALVRAITKQEYELARAEIANVGPLPAYQRSLQRHDARLAQAGDADTLACKAGCAWCCHFSVDVRPVEAFNILQFVEQNFTDEQKLRMRAEIVSNSEILKPLDDIQRMQHNIKCPFLVESRCSIYAARPQTCRNYHATDAAGCQQSFEQPDNLDIAPEYAPLTFQNGAAHVDAFNKAMRDGGYEIEAYELNGVLAETFNNPVGIWQRFAAGEPPFELTGTDVPLEFMDMEE